MSREPEPGSPLRCPAQVFREAPSPCRPVFLAGSLAQLSFWVGASEQLPRILVSAWVTEKDSPRAGLCLSLPAPSLPNFQCPVCHGLDQKARALVSGRARYPREGGEGARLSNSHSPTMSRAGASSLSLGRVPRAEGCHLQPQLCFHFRHGAEAALAPRGRAGRGVGDPDPRLRGSFLLLIWQPRMGSKWRVGGCQAYRDHRSRCHVP